MQRDNAERLMKASEENYRLMVDHSPDAVIVHSEGRIQYSNPATLKLLNVDSFEKIKDLDLLSFVHPDYKEIIREGIKKVYETNKPTEYEDAKFINRKLEVLDVEVIGIPVTYMGKPSVQSIVRDITERKRVEYELIKSKEKAEESDRLKTAFLHNISHEIRTPMNAIVGFSALLNEPDLTAEAQSTYIKTITQSSDQLLAIVKDIVEISNIEVGILKKSDDEFNLNEQLNLLFDQFNIIAVEKGIEFNLKKSLADGVARIRTDSSKLMQVISNLLSNAFKFTKQGEVNFGYAVRNHDIEFFVSDTGIGIPEEQYTKVFDRFYQIANSASRQFEGTGLGLPISKAYVELLGGRIWLTSEPGVGTFMYFTIPYEPVGVVEYTRTKIRKKITKKSERRKSILIAEDDDNNFFLMKELLSDLNIKIIRASNGIEAVDACRTGEKIDLVLMDIKMPFMDGYEATRQILKRSPGTKILAQTAYADDKEMAIISGCAGFISKPFLKNNFISKVKEYL